MSKVLRWCIYYSEAEGRRGNYTHIKICVCAHVHVFIRESFTVLLYNDRSVSQDLLQVNLTFLSDFYQLPNLSAYLCGSASLYHTLDLCILRISLCIHGIYMGYICFSKVPIREETYTGLQLLSALPSGWGEALKRNFITFFYDNFLVNSVKGAVSHFLVNGKWHWCCKLVN